MFDFMHGRVVVAGLDLAEDSPSQEEDRFIVSLYWLRDSGFKGKVIIRQGMFSDEADSDVVIAVG